MMNICFFNLNAQITLTAAQHNPIVGDLIKMSFGDTTNFNPGDTGANHTWDFSSLTLATGNINTAYISPGSTPYAASFPAASVSLYESSLFTYTYYKVSASSMNLIGIANPGLTLPYNDEEIYTKYPFTFRSFYNDNFHGSFTDIPNALKYDRTGTISSIADGYGILKLHGKVFNNVLRLKTIQQMDDASIDTDMGDTFETKHIYTRTYTWWTAIDKLPILEFTYMSQESDLLPGLLQETKYIKINQLATSIRVDPFPGNVRIYPNPCTDKLLLEINSPFNQSLTYSICDMSGRIILSKQSEVFTGYNRVETDVSLLSNGVYSLKINNTTTNLTLKFLICN